MSENLEKGWEKLLQATTGWTVEVKEADNDFTSEYVFLENVSFHDGQPEPISVFVKKENLQGNESSNEPCSYPVECFSIGTVSTELISIYRSIEKIYRNKHYGDFFASRELVWNREPEQAETPTPKMSPLEMAISMLPVKEDEEFTYDGSIQVLKIMNNWLWRKAENDCWLKLLNNHGSLVLMNLFASPEKIKKVEAKQPENEPKLEQWIPEIGEDYWFLSNANEPGIHAYKCEFIGDTVDGTRLSIANMFKTKEEAMEPKNIFGINQRMLRLMGDKAKL